jgi:hypothetical protein
MLGVWNVVKGKIGAGNPDPLTGRATENWPAGAVRADE